MSPSAIQQMFELAIRRHKAGQLSHAEQLYRQVLAERPDHADALHLLGVVAEQVGRHDFAVDLIRRSIAIQPNSPAAYFDLGAALLNLKDAGNLVEAADAFRRAVALKPDFADAWCNLGVALFQIKNSRRLDESIVALRQAIALKPASPEAHNNLGNALRESGQLDAAIAAYRKAVGSRPGYAEALCNLGVALKENAQLDDAIAAYRQAILVKPDYAEAHSNLAYILHFHPGCDARTIAEEHRRWDRQHAEPLRRFRQPHSNDRDPDRRLRIGYVSPDFRDHVVGRNLLPMFRQHDQQRFEIICYSHVVTDDAITGQFQQLADRWHNIGRLSDAQVADQIRRDKVDILVDTRLHMTPNRLLVFARKPAPIQATFAGYPGSTGVTAIAYRLSDPYLDPEQTDEGATGMGQENSFYAEKALRLPDSFWCYDPLDCEDLAVNALPARAAGVVTFGSLNNFCKVNEMVLAVWAKVLQKVAGSRLLLLAHAGSNRQWILDRLVREGINPRRIEFIARQSRRDYLFQHHRIDISLDTFPYNGHTTSLDSFWMGVPVVTLVGQTVVSRTGWCQLSNLGLADLAGHTPDDFMRIAVELACDLPRLESLRSSLRRRMERSPLMDANRFARGIESAYHQMWRTWCQDGKR